jgi:hypothetical protein
MRGEIDTEEIRREFPDAFSYWCCDGNADSEGCRVGRHWAADDERGGPPDVEEEEEEEDGEGSKGLGAGDEEEEGNDEDDEV